MLAVQDARQTSRWGGEKGREVGRRERGREVGRGKEGERWREVILLIKEVCEGQ